MTPEQITAGLIARGVTQQDIAVRAGLAAYNRSQVSAVVNRNSRSRKIETEIAAALERPIGEVFPEWYTPDGQRLRAHTHKSSGGLTGTPRTSTTEVTLPRDVALTSLRHLRYARLRTRDMLASAKARDADEMVATFSSDLDELGVAVATFEKLLNIPAAETP